MTFRVLGWPLAFLDRDLCQNIHIIRVYLKWLSIKACHHNITLSIFFFYQGFLSRTRMIHRTAGEGRGPFFIPLYHFHRSWTFRHLFATLHVRWLYIFLIATLVFTRLLLDDILPPYRITIYLIDWWCEVCFCLLDDLILGFCYSNFDTGNRWTRTITLVLQANRLTKCASHFI